MLNDSSDQLSEVHEHKLPARSSVKVLQIATTLATSLFLYIVPAFIAAFLVVFFDTFTVGVPWAQNSEFRQFLFVFATNVLVITLVIWFMKQTKETWRSIGVSRFGSRSFYYMLIGLVGYFVLYISVAIVASLLLPLDLEQRQQLGFEPGISGISLLLAFTSLVIMPPLFEEILFRGYLYTRFRRSASIVVSAMLVSVLFALAHLQFGSGNSLLWVAALDTFILSLVLVWLREKTGAIWAGVGVHALKNGLAFLLLFRVGL